MNDEETVALIAGGHAFGKSHGMVAAGRDRPRPEDRADGGDGHGLAEPEGTGFAQYTMTNGIEGRWTPQPDAVGQRLPRPTSSSSSGSRPRTRRRRHRSGSRSTRTPRRRPMPTSRADERPLMMMTSRHRAEGRPGLPRDLPEVPRRLRLLHRRLLQGVVQADPPRHGSEGPLPRPRGPRGGLPLAGPDARARRLQPVGDADIATLKQADPATPGSDGVRAGSTALASAVTYRDSPTSAAAPTVPASRSSRRRTGRSTIPHRATCRPARWQGQERRASAKRLPGRPDRARPVASASRRPPATRASR